MRSKERVKKLGEVFTPTKLVTEMLKKLPSEVWEDQSKTFLDNSCGNGQFLVAVVHAKIKCGNSSPIQALSTTYGVDIMQDNVDECKERILSQAEKASGQQRTQEWIDIVNKNIICHDALTYDYEFK
jgi:hypothetical protein